MPITSVSAESVGQIAAISRPVGYRSPAILVPEAIERLLRKYLVTRRWR